jgi:excisionase family DNA binding protein
VKAELTLPPELVDLITDKLLERLKPILSRHEKHEDDIILDLQGLAQYLKVTPKWIYEQTHLKTIPHLKLTNKQLRFRKKDIDKWLDTLKNPAIGEPTGKIRLVK